MADTVENIDEILDYLVSPAYLKMAADQQGEWNWQNAADPADLHQPAPTNPADGLAQWERELLEGAPVPVDPTPDPVQTLPPALQHRFGIQWDTDSQTCVCRGCRNRRRVSETPSLVGTQRPVQLRARTDGWERYADVIARRLPFNTYGSLRGRVTPESQDSGRLRNVHAAAANLWQADQRYIDYVIYSYQTPIAWHVTTNAGANEWIFPNVKYSQRTSMHQNKIKSALDTDSSPVRLLSTGRD